MNLAAGSTVGEPSFNRDSLTLVLRDVFDVDAGQPLLALCEGKRFGQSIKYDLKPVPGANRASEHAWRIAAVGDFKDERSCVTHLPERGQRSGPVDRSLERHEMVVATASVVVNVRCDHLAGQ